MIKILPFSLNDVSGGLDGGYPVVIGGVEEEDKQWEEIEYHREMQLKGLCL